jgi:hypothetical protein
MVQNARERCNERCKRGHCGRPQPARSTIPVQSTKLSLRPQSHQHRSSSHSSSNSFSASAPPFIRSTDQISSRQCFSSVTPGSLSTGGRLIMPKHSASPVVVGDAARRHTGVTANRLLAVYGFAKHVAAEAVSLKMPFVHNPQSSFHLARSVSTGRTGAAWRLVDATAPGHERCRRHAWPHCAYIGADFVDCCARSSVGCVLVWV